MKPLIKIINLILLATLLTVGQLAIATELIQWQPSPGYPKLILPRLKNETKEAAVERYLRAVQNSSKLQPLFHGSGVEKFDLQTSKVETFRNVVAAPGSPLETTKLRVALIANQASDLSDGARVRELTKKVIKAGGEPAVIALSADIGLSKKEASEFRTLVANRFDILLGMGGDDVDPRLYGEPKTHSVNVNRQRDVSELRLIKAYKESGRGVYFGICRGHQIGAVADGHTLYQDISKDGAGRGELHRHGYHHVGVGDSLFLRFLNNQRSPLVNSFHHQAVRVNENAASVPVAMANTVVEALEGKNKLSFSVQWHPEIGSASDFNLIRNIFAYSRLKRAELTSSSAPRCRNIFRRL